jgi:hypothetical protein
MVASNSLLLYYCLNSYRLYLQYSKQVFFSIAIVQSSIKEKYPFLKIFYKIETWIIDEPI